ncbi:MAG: hypothetical protein IJ834_05840 [Paludibacteraceae bacterium]|nr:hypothetical protein [Paludibacteraceae bacterium]
MKKKIFFAAIAALALVGCNDKNQSELSEEALGLNGEAKISATFYYNPGARMVDGVEVTENLPVPETVEVIAQVDYAEYTGAKAGVSFKQFKASAKGNGTYEVVIPAGEKKIAVTIIANGFSADYYLAPDNKITAYYPTQELAAFDVLAGQEFVKNDATETTFNAPNDILNNDRNVELTISGKLTGNVEVFDKDAKKAKTENQGFKGAAIEIKITSSDDDRELVYSTTTTNDEGKYELKVNLYDNWDLDNVEIEIAPKAFVAKFEHFYAEVDAKKMKDTYSDEAAFIAAGKAVIYDTFSAKNTVDVDGWWEGNAIKVAGLKNKVELFGTATGNDLSIVFTPSVDLATIPGVLSAAEGGEETEVQLGDKTEVTVQRYMTANLMGWK